MRPLRLEVEGFTSFREKVVLELDGLDLFAITGPTGAGKSSLIDAMVLALYGQVPRVSDRYKQLISHGAERMSVRLDFQVGGESYRIARTIRRSGTPQFRLERVTPGGSEPLADRAAEGEKHVQKIVGLDYDAFIRSVVLPQGQFDAFLKGKPEERRKILVALLNLRVYEDMQRLANARAAEKRREADFIAGQLAADFAQATPENLEAKKEELARTAAERERLERSQAALEVGVKAAQAVRTARREAEGASKGIAGEEARRASAGARLAAAGRERESLERRLTDVGERLATVAFDEGRHLALAGAKPRAEQLAQLAPRRDALAKQCAEREAALRRKREQRKKAEKALPAAEREAKRRQADLEKARADREDLQRRHAAHALRRHLKPGEPCPVCEQAVKKVPKGDLPVLALADEAVAGTERAVREARSRLEEARLDLERLGGAVTGLEAELSQLTAQRDEASAGLEALGEALREAGFEAKDLEDPKALLTSLAKELSALERARAERERLEAERKELETRRHKLDTDVATARAQAEAVASHIAELRRRRDEAAADLERARKALLALAGREGWDGLEEPPEGRDEADVLDARRAGLQKDVSARAGAAARLEADVERLERDIARAAELGARRKALERQAALAATLAQHLQANQFIAYVQEEALKVLAEDGSRHLKTLSQGRYSLACEAQDFLAVDHWNADMQRSVRTLSGGETFLASLALALALAERLAELSAEGRAGETLESLFLDEGFGTLDSETLDLVVQALEALHGGQRMVGVVTHLQDLAERMPARVQVGRAGGSATLTVA